MLKLDPANFAGGILLMLGGITIFVVAVSQYSLGSVTRMGPGMFPAGLGVILTFLGFLLFIQSLRRPGPPLDIRVISPLFVLGGIAAFALLIKPFGMIPAIVAATVVSSVADLRFRPASLFLLCMGLCLIVPFVFLYLLGLRVPVVAWPF